jgi:hypothetical protein
MALPVEQVGVGGWSGVELESVSARTHLRSHCVLREL